MRLSHGAANLFVAANLLATTVSRSRAQEVLGTDRDAAPKRKADKEDAADTGILLMSPIIAASNIIINAVSKSSSSSSAARSLQLPTTMMLTTSVAPQCSSGIVDCVYGMVRGSATITCAAACGPNCCAGVHACTSFTGKVCKDGSCNGKFACTYAYIPSVVNSCEGDYACYNTGYDGTVGNISNSCNAVDACSYLGTYGAAKLVQGSCNAYQACDSVAYNGSIGSLTSSCNATSACKGAGSPTNGTGTIPYDLLNCCNDGDSICIEANKDTLPTECRPDTEVRRRRRKRRCCCVMQSSYFSQLFVLHPCLSSSLLYHVVH